MSGGFYTIMLSFNCVNNVSMSTAHKFFLLYELSKSKVGSCFKLLKGTFSFIL